MIAIVYVGSAPLRMALTREPFHLAAIRREPLLSIDVAKGTPFATIVIIRQDDRTDDRRTLASILLDQDRLTDR